MSIGESPSYGCFPTTDQLGSFQDLNNHRGFGRPNLALASNHVVLVADEYVNVSSGPPTWKDRV